MPGRIGGILILLFLTACTSPTISNVSYETETTASQRSEGPVAELQRKSIEALNQNQYQQSLDYLQRAIKIEPRNAFTWHYLAQTYWHSQNYDRCVEMIDRSISYSSELDDLDRANATLRSQCEAS